MAFLSSGGTYVHTPALASSAGDAHALDRLRAAIVSAKAYNVPIDLWEPQNAYYRLAETQLAQARERAACDDSAAGGWLTAFDLLGKALGANAPVEDA